MLNLVALFFYAYFQRERKVIALAWNKEKDLQLKYEYIPEDAANAHANRKKKAVKKSKHKHIYEPIVIDYYSRYVGWTTFYGSYCPKCGKINYGDMGAAENELKSLFPQNVNSIFAFKFNADEEFEKYCKSHYRYLVIKDFDYLNTKFLPQDYMD